MVRVQGFRRRDQGHQNPDIQSTAEGREYLRNYIVPFKLVVQCSRRAGSFETKSKGKNKINNQLMCIFSNKSIIAYRI